MSDGWQRRQQHTRTAVIESAAAIIAAEGLDGLTMRKLAEAAGVAVATLYNQFGDRKGVLVALVSAGLDDLEDALDAEPPSEPIEATRTMFAGFDTRFEANPEVWRPVLSALKSAPGPHGFGAIGERIVTTIAADFAKAVADDMFDVDVDVDLLARHVFTSWVRELERWAHGIVEWDAYRAAARLSVELPLAAVLAEPHRAAALARSTIVG